jgi:hypothetical protein
MMIELNLLNDDDKKTFKEIYENIKTEFSDNKETSHLSLILTDQDNSLEDDRNWHDTDLIKTLEINSDDISQFMDDLLSIKKFYIFQSMSRARDIFVYISKDTLNKRICYTAYFYWEYCIPWYVFIGLPITFLKKWHNQATWRDIIFQMYALILFIIGFLVMFGLLIHYAKPIPETYTLDQKNCFVFINYVNTTCTD